MQAGKPSGTAYRVALRRAAHQVFDQPVVFADPLALRILGITDQTRLGGTDLRAPSRASSAGLRAFLVARSRFAEDALAGAVSRGIAQYVLLGAGLDTFAYRNPHAGLRVFEVDHPDTQAWKLSLLERAAIPVPATVRHVPVDFHQDTLAEQLQQSGFAWDRPAVFAWLGVVPYLTAAGFQVTLETLSRCSAGSLLLFDYGLPRHALPKPEQREFDSLAARVAAAGEPFQLFFTPDEVRAQLAAHGWSLLEDVDRDGINERYFQKGTLRCVSSGRHLLSAELIAGSAVDAAVR